MDGLGQDEGGSAWIRCHCKGAALLLPVIISLSSAGFLPFFFTYYSGIWLISALCDWNDSLVIAASHVNFHCILPFCVQLHCIFACAYLIIMWSMHSLMILIDGEVQMQEAPAIASTTEPKINCVHYVVPCLRLLAVVVWWWLCMVTCCGSNWIFWIVWECMDHCGVQFFFCQDSDELVAWFCILCRHLGAGVFIAL